MLYRPVAAVFAAAMIALVCGSLAKAQDASGQCIAKDQIIEMNKAPGVHFRKVTGGDADALRVYIDKLDPGSEPDKVGYTYVVFMMVKADRVLIVGFDEHNCAKYKIGAPKDIVLEIIGDMGA